jgi:hypothetical protein
MEKQDAGIGIYAIKIFDKIDFVKTQKWIAVNNV